jgi:excisionase family DNA binding protein
MTEFLTVGEMAAMLRVSKATVYRLLNGRQIPGAFRLGHTGGWRIPEDFLEEWIRGLTDNHLKKDRTTGS